MLRYAFCAALYDGELDALLEPFATATGIEAPTGEALKRRARDTVRRTFSKTCL